MAGDAEGLTKGWRFVGIGVEGQAIDVGGINPWQLKWQPTGRSVTVAHPQYPNQRHRMDVYSVEGTQPATAFAAGEFSNGVWGFFVPA